MSNALKGKGYKDVIAYIKENSDNARVPSGDFKVMLVCPIIPIRMGKDILSLTTVAR